MILDVKLSKLNGCNINLPGSGEGKELKSKNIQTSQLVLTPCSIFKQQRNQSASIILFFYSLEDCVSILHRQSITILLTKQKDKNSSMYYPPGYISERSGQSTPLDFYKRCFDQNSNMGQVDHEQDQENQSKLDHYPN